MDWARRAGGQCSSESQLKPFGGLAQGWSQLCLMAIAQVCPGRWRWAWLSSGGSQSALTWSWSTQVEKAQRLWSAGQVKVSLLSSVCLAARVAQVVWTCFGNKGAQLVLVSSL